MKEISRPFKDSFIRLRYQRLGKDMQVLISGGREHIGAVALAVHPHSKTEPVYAWQAPGHREEEMARASALRLSNALGCSVAVSAGIHFDNLGKEEIEAIVQMVDEMVADLIEVLKWGIKNEENINNKRAPR